MFLKKQVLSCGLLQYKKGAPLLSKIEYWKVRFGPQGGAFLYKSLLSILLLPPGIIYLKKLEGIVTNYKTNYLVNAILKLKWNWRWILTQAVNCMTCTLLPLPVMGETGQGSCHCFHDHVGNMLRIFKKFKKKLLRRGRYFNLANHSTQKTWQSEVSMFTKRRHKVEKNCGKKCLSK